MRTGSSVATSERVLKPAEPKPVAQVAVPPKASPAPFQVKDGLDGRQRQLVELKGRPLSPAVQQGTQSGRFTPSDGRALRRIVDLLGDGRLPVKLGEEQRGVLSRAADSLQDPLSGRNLKAKEVLESLLTPGTSPLHLDKKQLETLQESLKEFVYEQKLQGLSDEELDAELQKQKEILEDAKSGPVKDADAAREARERIASLKEEKSRRILADPNASPERVARALKNLDDAALRAEERRLQKGIESADNPTERAALEERLAAVRSEKAQRVVDDPSTSPVKYADALDDLSDPALTTEQAEQQAHYDELMAQAQKDPSRMQDPKFVEDLQKTARNLEALNGELKERGLSAQSSSAPAEDPQAAEEASPEEASPEGAASGAGSAQGQGTYTVKPGDTLSQVAAQISAENGGVPDAQTVLNDIVRMNPQIENPDLIYPDQQIHVPQYGAGTPGSSPETPSTDGPAEPSTSTPGGVMSPEEAFICQFTEGTYNPTGPSHSTNCGPASLAMGMAYTGRMPPGLSKEQQVDYARALMSPGREAEFTYVTDANGQQVPQLDRDSEYTGGTMVADGVRAAGGNPIYGETWGDLDAQLEAGHPVMAGGWVSDEGGDGLAWKQQFPGGVGPGAYGTGTTGHLISILGKTADGKYIVADPLYARGPVEMTKEQLALYFSQTGGNPSFTALA
ncbi:LysM peptidoglycan-binding domain-containing protein [Hyalangium sp.]|uniref:LysM peptidoglycan-binding domain-containing protein n=1 Tax=Hyalangium sp. TaxID=2028555 RepID=UPI002D321E5A|nr:LysM peptidoglycan-binding domain-containing protein [Hyalangium sp.]HYI00008.1 LysM peptidoglycan-binding domain-containing protein [Hyalangium sp.]